MGIRDRHGGVGLVFDSDFENRMGLVGRAVDRCNLPRAVRARQGILDLGKAQAQRCLLYTSRCV